MDIPKWLFSFLPEDPEDKAGWGPFTISEDAAWMEGVFAEYHDQWYRQGPAIGMRLSEIDARVFKGLSILATQPHLDWIEQCHRINDVCLYWPIMRRFGHLLYGRHRTQAEKELPPL